MPAHLSDHDLDAILAFRLARHNLSQRLPPGELLVAAGVCGVQNTPPGAAELSLHARLEGLQPGQVRRALEQERTLLQAWSLRGAPTLFPSGARAVFTLGLLGGDEAEQRHWLSGGAYFLEQVGLSAAQLINLCAEHLLPVLDGQAKTKDVLGIEIAARIHPHLPAPFRQGWAAPSPIVKEQTLGESLVRFALPSLSHRGLCCHAERIGNQAYLRRTDQWLAATAGTPSAGAATAGDGAAQAAGAGGPAGSPGAAQLTTAAPSPQAPPAGLPAPEALQEAAAGLARRFLGAYGPATVKRFALWSGMSPQQAARAWRTLAGEMFSTAAGMLLERDRAFYQAPPPALGVRFLPAHDPYLQCRDRDRLLPDRRLQRSVWRTVGSPGALLVDGRLAATWRARRQKGVLQISIEPFTLLPPPARAALDAEAAALGPFHDCHSVEVVGL